MQLIERTENAYIYLYIRFDGKDIHTRSRGYLCENCV